MSIQYIDYFVHDCTINGNRIKGVQTVSFDKNIPSTDIVNWGNPNESVPLFKREQSVDFIFDKFLSNGIGPFLTGFDLQSLIGKMPVDNYELGVTIYGGPSLKIQECILSGMNFEFNRNGIFKEQIAFEGFVSDVSSAGTEGTGSQRTEEGITYRRQHYIKSFLPSEIPSSYPLLKVTVSLNIEYGSIAAYGKYYLSKNKFMTFPCSVSCEYEVLDLGYSQGDIDILSEEFIDNMTFRTIKIQTIPVSIDLGNQNKLVAITRSGGSAGGSEFSILTFRYENINNFFKVTFGSSDTIDGNLIFEDMPILDGNALTEISLVDGNN